MNITTILLLSHLITAPSAQTASDARVIICRTLANHRMHHTREFNELGCNDPRIGGIPMECIQKGRYNPDLGSDVLDCNNLPEDTSYRAKAYKP